MTPPRRSTSTDISALEAHQRDSAEDVDHDFPVTPIHDVIAGDDISISSSETGREDPVNLPLVEGGEKPTARLDSVSNWTPLCLRRWSLYGFIAIFALVLAGLVIIFAIDRQSRGLATSNEGWHYLWTYGPTLVLSLLATFWEHVDFRTRQSFPWSILSKTDTRASDTLLLDYTSQADFIVLWKSAKARHWSPFLTSTTTLLIRLLIILSTGLLVLEAVPGMERELQVSTQDAFDAAATARAVNGTVPSMFAYGVTDLALEYPSGTSDTYAMPSLNTTTLAIVEPDTRVSFSTDAFRGDLKCDTGILSFPSQSACCQGNDCGIMPCIQVDSPGCKVFAHLWPNNDIYEFPFPAIMAAAFNLPCKGSNHTRYVFAAGLVSKNASQKLDVLVCSPSNVFVAVQAQVDQDGRLLEAQEVGQAKHATTSLSITDSGVHKLFMSSLYNSATLYQSVWNDSKSTLNDVQRGNESDNPHIIVNGTKYYCFFDDFFALYLVTAKPRSTAELFDHDVLRSKSRWLYSIVTAQVAKTSLMVPTQGTRSATMQSTQQRLRVQVVSFYGILGVLILVLAASITVSIIAPRQVVSRDPGTIAGQSAILARSGQLDESLRPLHFQDGAAMRSQLKAYECQSSLDYEAEPPTFCIIIHKEDAEESSVTTTSQENMPGGWWRPFSLSPWTKATVLFVLISLETTLEVLLHYSKRDHGLANVVLDDTKAQYAWRYVPGTFMVILSMIVGMIASDSKVLLPYHELRYWPSTASRTICNDERSHLAVVTLYKSIVYGHWAILATTMATLAAFPLTIVSSGLYYTQMFNSTTAVTYSIKNIVRFPSQNWTPDFYGLNGAISGADSSEVSVRVSMLLNRNMSTPLWTYDNYLIPELSFSHSEDESEKLRQASAPAGSSLDLNTPAWTSVLSCDYIPHDRLDQLTVYQPLGSTYDDKQLLTGFNGSASCPEGDGSIEADFYKVPEGAPFYLNNIPEIAHQIMYFGPRHSYLTFVYGTMPPLTDSDGLEALNVTSLEVMSCCARLDQLDVRVTMDPLTLRITNLVPYPGTEQETPEGKAYGYPIYSVPFEAIFSIVDTLWHRSDGESSTGSNVSEVAPFFKAVLSQNPTLRIDDLLGKENNKTLASGLTSVWAAVYAQVANKIARYPRVDNETWIPATVAGNLTQPDRLRLVQSPISTHILTALLGIITLCVAASFWSMNTRDIIPNNPSSIAAAMSLLSGAKMLEDIPAGSEWIENGETELKGTFEGQLYSMGWWDDDHGGRRFGIDAGKAKWSR